MSEERSPTMIEEEGNQANVDDETTSSTETDDLEPMQSRSKLALTQETFARKLPKSMKSVAYYALVQGLQVLRDMSVGEISRIKEFDLVKETGLFAGRSESVQDGDAESKGDATKEAGGAGSNDTVCNGSAKTRESL